MVEGKLALLTRLSQTSRPSMSVLVLFPMSLPGFPVFFMKEFGVLEIERSPSLFLFSFFVKLRAKHKWILAKL